MLTLEQVRGFVAVAEELHFGRAAERLSMTQPPLSRQIKKLERSVGVDLFERDNRSVALTAAGQAFLPEARRLLALAETAPEIARSAAQGVVGTVSIGFTAVSAFRLLGGLLGEIATALPHMTIALHELVSSAQLEQLTRGELDLGLLRPPVDNSTFASRLVMREPLVAAVREDHRLAALDRPVRADDLRDEDLVMYSPSDARYFYDLTVSALRPVRPRVAQHVTQVHTMVALVAADRGVALVPRSAAALGVQGVRIVDFQSRADLSVELYAVWRRDSRNPALQQVLKVLAESAQADELRRG